MHNETQPIMLFLLLAGLSASAAAVADLSTDVADIQSAWAMARYQTPAKEQGSAFKALTERARDVVAAYPDKPEAKVWMAIVLSTDAGVNGGISALGKVKEARKLLEEAEAINADVLDGSVYTSLGSLYYQVPGWPLGFGDDRKAAKYLKKALAVNPGGIDANYFYGDFLLEEGEPAEAIPYFEKALVAPPRPNRELADQGRRDEVMAKLATARAKLN